MVGLLRQWGQPAEVAVAALSGLAGVVYFHSVIRIAAHLAAGTSQYIVSVVGLFALGASQLWFGHVENYSLVTAAALIAICQAVGFLRGESSLWSVGVMSGLAVSFHPQAAFLTPTVWRRYAWNRAVVTAPLVDRETSRALWPPLTLSSLLTIAWILLNHAPPQR